MLHGLLVRLVLAALVLAVLLAYSSSLSPLRLVFGEYWQEAAAGIGILFGIVLCAIGFRSDRG